MSGNGFRVGDRVWWQTTAAARRYGTVAIVEVPDERPGVRPDEESDCVLYLDADQLHRAARKTIVPTTSPPGIPDVDGIYSRIPDTLYHSDTDSLSSSGAHTLTTLTPAEYKAALDEPPAPKPEYDYGHCCHKMVLGEGGRFAVLDPAIHGRRKDGSISTTPKATAGWKQAEKTARDKGKIPVTRDQMDTAQRMAGKVFEHRLAAKLLEAGAAELSGWWHDPDTGVRLRFRPDWLPDVGAGRPIIVDYKSARSANPRRFAKAAYDFGYHQSAAWYIDGLGACTGATDAAFLWIVQMKDPPFLVSVCQLEPEHIELGRAQNRAAIDVYARCRQTGSWPGYDGLTTIALPGWAVRQIEDDLEEPV